MTDKDKRRIIQKLDQGFRVVTCQGCGERIRADDSLADVEYVKTKRRSDIFFHTRCMGKIWKSKIR